MISSAAVIAPLPGDPGARTRKKENLVYILKMFWGECRNPMSGRGARDKMERRAGKEEPLDSSSETSTTKGADKVRSRAIFIQMLSRSGGEAFKVTCTSFCRRFNTGARTSTTARFLRSVWQIGHRLIDLLIVETAIKARIISYLVRRCSWELGRCAGAYVLELGLIPPPHSQVRLGSRFPQSLKPRGI